MQKCKYCGTKITWLDVVKRPKYLTAFPPKVKCTNCSNNNYVTKFSTFLIYFVMFLPNEIVFSHIEKPVFVKIVISLIWIVFCYFIIAPLLFRYQSK
ncbi:MAG: hypothetical protein ACOWWH_04290 [Eubacteriaceae bacterium]